MINEELRVNQSRQITELKQELKVFMFLAFIIPLTLSIFLGGEREELQIEKPV